MIQPVRIAPEVLLDRAAEGVPVVTAGARLAGFLFHEFGRRMAARGLSAWESPRILPWSTWLGEWWTEAGLRGMVPDLPVPGSEQEHVAWSHFLSRDTTGLAHVDGAVSAARDAHHLALEWDLDPHADGVPCSDDARAWLGWDRAYAQWLREAGWQDPAAVGDRLAGSAGQGGWIPGERLVITGFDELTPRQQRVIAALEDAGCSVEWLEHAGVPGEAVLLPCEDTREEVRRAAAWARVLMDSEPEARIAIVVPDLGGLRPLLEQELDRVLMPAAAVPGAGALRRPYNVSLGSTLAAVPVVRMALTLLGIADRRLLFGDAAALLGSPYLAGAEDECSGRALVDAKLREDGQPQVTLDRMGRLARKLECPQLAALVDRLGSGAGSGRDRSQAPSAWAREFSERLERCGWAAGRPLDSAEYQAVDRFRGLLSDLVSLEPVSGEMDRESALQHLRRMAGQCIFQPASDDARLQVLGVLESVGMVFDHLWLLGLHAAAWPPPPRPNPFLPRGLQAERGVPRSTPGRELQVARQQTARLLASAPDIVISHPRHADDEALRCSPLVAGIRPAAAGEVPGVELVYWGERIAAAGALEALEPGPGPGLEPGAAKGGSGLLLDQSACPFRAFAKYRLGARELGEVDVGLDAMRRGSLMHRALELFWTGLGSHADLLALGEDGARDRVGTSVDAALDEFARDYPLTVTAGFRRVERERLCGTLSAWLELERSRTPFRVVGLEEPCEVGVGGLRLSLKIDRLDELDDGARVVIDYKTGKVKPSEWFGARPAAPQLPLYSEAVGESVAAVAFGVLRAEGVKFAGVGRSDGLLPGVASSADMRDCGVDWDHARDEWRAVLGRLAGEFLSGAAEVDPLRYPATCRYCELGSLCRVGEKLRVPDAGDYDDG